MENAEYRQQHRARPPIKSAGGKSKLADAILAIMPKPKRYFEPFVGGGAVFWAVQESYPGTPSFLNDANSRLMDVYETIRDDPAGLILELKNKRYANTKEAFLKVRESNFSGSIRRRAADFVYLSKTGFNGLYRVNKSNQFNVPFGKYENPLICDEVNIRACSRVLQYATLTDFDFEIATIGYAGAGDCVYFDPPYVPASKTADFTAYTAAGFTKDDQVRLHDVALKLKERDVFVLLSNSDTPFVRELYRKKDWKLVEVQMSRSINNDATKRGKVGELLIY